MRRLLAFLVCLVPIGAAAQETAGPETAERDRSFLTALIEDNLSGAGRSVRLDGFAGALSSRATFDQLTIADGAGVWITIRGGAISWNRAALLKGRIEIAEMTAAEIDLPRRPVVPDRPSQAAGFALPELPVAVAIGTLRADRVRLGAPVIGVAADVQAQGAMRLDGGEGHADIAIARIDGKQGTLSLTGAYANATREATLDLLVKEAADGIAVELLGIPGRPSAELAIHGSGIIDQFRADVAVRTGGQPRVTGHVQLGTVADASGSVIRSFATQLSGDVAPLFLPEYQEFFGDDVSLEAEGRLLPSGQKDLTRLVVDSEGVDLTGRLSLNSEGLPLQAAMTLRAGLTDGSDVLLPIPGEKTYVSAADLRLRYDSRAEAGWTIEGTMNGLKRPALTLDTLEISGSGRVDPDGVGAAAGVIGGTVRFTATGIRPADAALQQAVGPAVSGNASFDWQPGSRLRFPAVKVTGQGYSAAGRIAIGGVGSGVELAGGLTATVEDLQRLSGLAGREVGGSGTVSVKGSYGLLSGIADAELDVRGRDLRASAAELDNLLKGDASFAASIRRDESGTRIRAASLSARTLKANAEGTISSLDSDIRASLAFADLSAMGGSYRGSLTASAAMTGPAEARQIVLTAAGDGLGVGQAEIDRIIGGRSDLELAVVQRGAVTELQDFTLKNGQVSVDAHGTPSDQGQIIALTSRLSDMALLAPGFPGPLTLDGRIVQRQAGYDLDLTATGPGNTTAAVTGTAAADLATADLRIAGGAQSAVVNPFIAPRNISGPVSFDLRMNGVPGLPALSGNISLRDGTLVAPSFGIELNNVGITADLAGQRAAVSGSGRVEGGGEVRISGPISLAPPFAGDLAINLAAASLRDPELYDTDVSGLVRISGPLTGGATISGGVTLGTTELRIPSTGFGNQTLLDNVTHVAEPAAVRQTRQRAGMLEASGSSRPAVRPFGLDLAISAPRRIFVRGRGLDAELGGALSIGGTTASVVPSGQFNLIRGRLDILGKRFTIDEGLIQLQGALTPYVRFGATTESEGIRATILIEGDATAPDIRFLSVPELPQEEVISRLLFAKNLTTLSPLQAARLASAVATLAGTGGTGIISKLRQSFGFDDLDLTSAEDGTTGVRLGKYISEKLYTDVDIGSDGKAEVNINLDVRPDLTLRGTLAGDGTSGVGIYYERDY